MQKIVTLVLLIIFLVSGSVLAFQIKKQLLETPSEAQPSLTPTSEAEPSPITESAQQVKTTPQPTLTVKPINKPTSHPTKSQGSRMQQYVYPGSTIISQSNENLTLESSDDTMQIVSWYKQALEREDAQIKNTVVNTINGKTTATLTVSTNGQNMYVTITHSDASTTIKLEQK